MIKVPYRLFPELDLKAFQLYIKYLKIRDYITNCKILGISHDFDYFHNYRSCQNRRYMDRESQYFIKNRLEYDGDFPLSDAIFQLIFRKEETYRKSKNILGDYPANVLMCGDIGVDKVIEVVKSIDIPFTGAYLVPHINKDCDSKVSGWLELFRHVNFEDIMRIERCEDVFHFFKNITGFGDFLAMQFTTELGWLDETHYGGNEFVIPGNGAVRGLNKIGIPPKKHVQFLHWLVKINLHMDDDFLPMTLMDYQNTFCEFDKYTRFLGNFDNQGRERQKRKFSPSKKKYN